MPSKITRIVTHAQPHLDELVAIFLLRQFGTSAFPGIKSAAIEFWRQTGPAPNGRSADDYEQDGILLIGVGHGRFDEHPGPHQARKKGQSASSLVAKTLRIHRRLEVRPLIEYTTLNDIEGRVSRFELAELVRKLNRLYPNDPMRVYRWTMDALTAELAMQRQFHGTARRAYAKHAQIIEISLGGQTLRVVAIQSDVDQVKSYAFSVFGCQAAIVVQRNSQGNIQVFASKQYDLDLTRTAEAIRLAELQAKSQDPLPDCDYAAEGTLIDVPEWFYFVDGQMLLNGSHTAPEVAPSRLSLSQVTELVMGTLQLSAAVNAA